MATKRASRGDEYKNTQLPHKTLQKGDNRLGADCYLTNQVHHWTKKMRFSKTAGILGLTLGVCYGIKKLTKSSSWHGIAIKAGAMLGAVGLTMPAYAIQEAQVGDFARTLNSAANSQNIGQVAELIDEGAVISITRQGKTSTLDKNAYLQLLQKNWAGAKNYHYQLQLGDVVISGNQAKVHVSTTETWLKDGQKITLVTSAKATLVHNGKGVVLLRSVAQIHIQ